MKKFESIYLTYERLKGEIETLTSKSIEKNKEFNEINTKLQEAKEEHQREKEKIQEDIHKWKAEVVNIHKEYKNRLDNKEERLLILEKQLQEKSDEQIVIQKQLRKKHFY